MGEKEFRELLLRVANGKATPQEIDRIERLVHKAALSDRQQHDIKNIQKEVTNNILSKINKPKRFVIRRNILKYAAVIVILVVGYYSFLFIKSNSNESVETIASVELIESYSEYGQQNNLKLSDGSQVKLNAGTKLFYPEKFTGGQRRLTLEGQAFFDVARDTTKPFIIDAGEMQITVLGTSFDIKAFNDDNVSSVTVLSGKVKVALKGSKGTLVLTPDKQLNYDVVSGKYKIQTVDAQESIAWVDGVLRFEESHLEDVFRQMQRWYNIKVIVEEGVDSQCTVSGRHKNQGFNIVLEGLHYTHGLEYQLKSDTVLITKINCD